MIRAIRWVYNRVLRPFLPHKVIVHNGIPANTGRLLDAQNHRETWEEDLMRAIRSRSFCGKHVVEVGTGFGICTAEIAKRVGPDGKVIAYEGDSDRVEKAIETLKLNGVMGVVDLHAEYVKCIDEDPDILVTDCEGCEAELLDGDYGSPNIVIVETHPTFGVPTDDITSSLMRDGYQISDVYSSQEGIDVVVGEKE